MLALQTWTKQAEWWKALATHLGVEDKGEKFFHNAADPNDILKQIGRVGGDLNYILFVLLRHWIPVVLPPPGRERNSKTDPDYWLESAEILNAAVDRLRELKPLINLLTTSSPFRQEASQSSPVVEVELTNMLKGIAESTSGYGGPDYTSTIKNFDPIPLRQIQPFKHNKKHSAEVWVVFLLREHFRNLGMGKDRYWPLIAEIISAAGIWQPNEQPFTAGELKSWWTKNWPRTYTLLKEKGEGTQASHTAYQSDYEWFQAWLAWQVSQSSKEKP